MVHIQLLHQLCLFTFVLTCSKPGFFPDFLLPSRIHSLSKTYQNGLSERFSQKDDAKHQISDSSQI